MKAQISHHTQRNQPRTTHALIPPCKITELQGKEVFFEHPGQNQIFYKENKSDCHHSDSNTYARKERGSNIVKTKKTRTGRFYTQSNFKYKDQSILNIEKGN